MACDFNINEAQVAEEIAGRPMPENAVDIFQWAFEIEAKIRYMKADAMLKFREM